MYVCVCALRHFHTIVVSQNIMLNQAISTRLTGWICESPLIYNMSSHM